MQLLMKHGEMYGLQFESAGRLKRGTIYVTLGRMEAKNYIRSRQEEPLPGAIGLPRRMYKLTDYGTHVLHAWETYRDVFANPKRGRGRRQ